MAYSVDIIYSKNQDFSNPLTETEAGQPQSVELTNLDSNETYYTKAVLKNNGTVEDESTVETFATLPAGTIALTHQSSARQGGDYVVVYTYTSTYALSSSVLRCGATIAAQGVISGNTITYTVSGLTPGDAYIYDITTIDIYAETNNITGSLVMPVVNIVAISLQEALADEISFDLDYTVDSGMVSGYLNYWLGSDDPSTDQPQGHFHFSYGDTDVTADGLTAGTSYKFRAEIVLNDGQSTEIVSNVVGATTIVDYLKMPFTVENIDSETGVFTFKRWTNLYTYYTYSIDGGTTWNNVTISTRDITVNVPSGGKIQILGNNTTNGMVFATDNHAAFVFSKKFTVYGNIVSLFDKENYETLTVVRPSNADKFTFTGLLKNNTTLESAENLNFGNLSSIGEGLQFSIMFLGCTNLKIAPKTIGIRTNNTCNSAFNGMFSGCSNLITVPVFENGFVVGNAKSTFKGMFKGCSALKNGMDMRNFTWSFNTGYNNESCSNMYYDCSSITLVYAPNVKGAYQKEFVGWLTNVPQNGTLHKRTLLNLPANSADGIPSGWTVVNHLNY